MPHQGLVATLLSAVTVAAAALALSGCGSDDAEAATTEGAAGSAATATQRGAQFRNMAGDRLAEDTPKVPVEVAEVRRGVVEAYYRGSTNLTAAEEAVVVARTLGVVEALFVE